MTDNKRPFKVSANVPNNSAVLQIEIGNTILSVATIDGVNEMMVLSKDKRDTISQSKVITDFSDVIHMMWNLEKL